MLSYFVTVTRCELYVLSCNVVSYYATRLLLFLQNLFNLFELAREALVSLIPIKLSFITILVSSVLRIFIFRVMRGRIELVV